MSSKEEYNERIVELVRVCDEWEAGSKCKEFFSRQKITPTKISASSRSTVRESLYDTQLRLMAQNKTQTLE